MRDSPPTTGVLTESFPPLGLGGNGRNGFGRYGFGEGFGNGFGEGFGNGFGEGFGNGFGNGLGRYGFVLGQCGLGWALPASGCAARVGAA